MTGERPRNAPRDVAVADPADVLECALAGHQPSSVILSSHVATAISAACSCRAVTWLPHFTPKEEL